MSGYNEHRKWHQIGMQGDHHVSYLGTWRVSCRCGKRVRSLKKIYATFVSCEEMDMHLSSATVTENNAGKHAQLMTGSQEHPTSFLVKWKFETGSWKSKHQNHYTILALILLNFVFILPNHSMEQLCVCDCVCDCGWHTTGKPNTFLLVSKHWEVLRQLLE